MARNKLARVARLVANAQAAKETLYLESGLAAEITAAESDPAVLAKFSMTAYTGGPMRPGGWWRVEPIILDISGMQRPNGNRMPIHRQHDPDRIVGHSDSIVGGNKILVKGVISAKNAHSAEVVESSRNGFPWQASVGARLVGSPDFYGEGQTVTVNGQKFKGPIYVSRKWRLIEASFVSLGADPDTSAIAAEMEDNQMFEDWLKAHGFDPAQISDEQRTVLYASYQGSLSAGPARPPQTPPQAPTPGTPAPAPAPTPSPNPGSPAPSPSPAPAPGPGGTPGGSPGAPSGSLTAADLEASIARAAAQSVNRQFMLQATLGSHPDLLARAVAESWDDARCRNERELVELRASYSRGPAIHSINSPEGQARRVQIEAAMYMAGVGTDVEAVQIYGQEVVESARRNMPTQAGLRFLLHECIRAAGHYAHPGVVDNDTIRAAFQADRELHASSGFSTISMSGILSNIANKTMLRAYNEVPSVVRRFARTTPHSDFKAHSKYRITSPGELEKVGASGEIKHTELDEEPYSNQVETFARMIALTRQMMRNDDMGGFLQIPAMFGRMAARTHEKSVFTVLLDNADNFFNAAPAAGSGFKPNMLATGAGSALSSTSLAEAETLFWSQEDKNGNPIDLVPSILLVSPAKYRDAVNLVTKTTMTVVGDPATGTQLQVGNQFQGQFEPVMSPYLSASSIPGADPDKWFLLSSPSADVALIEIAYLDGRQSPIIESAETDFNTLGMQWRAYWDWGVAKQDRRAGIYSRGE